ncbi:prepilin peptidase [Clostridium sp. UBA6640]|uniref:prepilin peptidase n=1 Tax=Clostridium sp. UBA6640 TaxID=1946370 RepID=UPI0025C2D3D9|nr:A24 family peptidase [Clostridium sp. UBA6640]
MIFLYSFIFIIGFFLGKILNLCIDEIIKNDREYKIKKGKYNIQNWLVQLVMGIMLLLLYIKYGLGLQLVKLCILSFFIIMIGVIDFNTKYVYNVTVYGAIILGVIFTLIEYINGYPIKDYIFGALLGGGVFFTLILITKFIYKKEVIGYGDLEFSIIIGVFLGATSSILVFVLANILATIICMYMIAKGESRKKTIPYTPFITIATFIVILYKDIIIRLIFGN